MGSLVQAHPEAQTFWPTNDASLAQLVEQLTLNQWVQGSSPWGRTKGMGKSLWLSHLLERWQSGRLHRSWKPTYWEVPGVRIPLSPLKGVNHGFTPFLFNTIQKSSGFLKPLLLSFKKELGIVFVMHWPKNHAFDSSLLWKNILIAKLCIY